MPKNALTQSATASAMAATLGSRLSFLRNGCCANSCCQVPTAGATGLAFIGGSLDRDDSNAGGQYGGGGNVADGVGIVLDVRHHFFFGGLLGRWNITTREDLLLPEGADRSNGLLVHRGGERDTR